MPPAMRCWSTAPISGLRFDGDGDRCGVIDNEGEAIYADKVGVMLARDIAARNPGALFVADVKSTGLFLTDPVLKQHGATTKFWKTGHSYIKRYSHETGALVGWKSPDISSSTRRLAAAMTTAWWRGSRCSICSTATPEKRSPS